jgi:glucose-1-phosphate cytidylyltransferase
MKVVLFCGGLGLRLKEYSGNVPKPMVIIGHRPILWHVMKYYAHYGHKDFILCLGYQSEVIKNYFLNYDECISNDFTMSGGGKKIDIANRDIEDWTITFVDTGMHSNIGQRLKAVEPYLKGEEIFLANYSDNVTDFPLPDLVRCFLDQGKVAGFLCVKPSHSFHVVETKTNGDVSSMKEAAEADIWLNGGYFVFRQEIFKYINDGDELVKQPFQKLIRENKLMAYKYDGFWACMDTFKERQCLEDLSVRGDAPWKVW